MIMSASVALLFAVPMVQVFINSGGGGRARVDAQRAGWGVARLAGSAWPLFSLADWRYRRVCRRQQHDFAT